MDDLKATWARLVAHIDALAAERDHYLEFFERSLEAYVRTDAAGTIREVNGAAVDVFRRRRRELQANPLPAMIALDHRPEFRRRLGAVLQSRAPVAWHTVVESPGLRTAVRVAARPVARGGVVDGICWLLQPE